MILKDFEDGGFPINKRNPVLCFTDQGDLLVAYDRFTLKLIIENRTIKKCVGMWPGKYETDCFPLKPAMYKVAPPEAFRSIDNALSILVYYREGLKFKHLIYVAENTRGEKIEIQSDSPELLEYITKIGLKFKSIFDS